MPKRMVAKNARGLDMELVKVGRACVSQKAVPIVDNVLHQICVRRKRGLGVTYTVADAEVATPTRLAATTAAHVWRFLPGKSTRYIVVRVLTLGGVVDSNRPGFTVTTTTDATATVYYVADAAAPTSTLSPRHLLEHEAIRQVTPDTLETVTVAQNHSTALARILAIEVEELPVAQIDTSVDTWAMDKVQVASGTDIIEHATTPIVVPREYNGVPALVATLRRYGKHILWSHGKEHTTTATAAFDFLAYAAAANKIDWNTYQTPCLPESAGVSVTCRVFAKDSVATNGNVRFAFGGVNIDIANITNGAAAWYSATGTIAKVTDTVSYQGWNTAAGTLSVYSAEVYADVEAT